jgi:hypothetical protein
VCQKVLPKYSPATFEDESFHIGRHARVEQVERAETVVSEVGTRVPDRLAPIRVAGEMEHEVGALQHRPERFGISQVRDAVLDSPLHRWRAYAIDHDDALVMCTERPDEMATDEAAPTGYHNPSIAVQHDTPEVDDYPG